MVRCRIALKWFVFVLLLSAVAVFWVPAGSPDDPQIEKWLAGDVIFFTGSSWRSRVVQLRQLGDRQDFSHVGVVVIEDGKPFVIHAKPDTGLDGRGEVVKERWDDIVTPKRISGGAVYRLRKQNEVVVEAVCSVVQKYAHDRVRFDHSFDMTVADELYCTELVWRAFHQAGIDLCPNLTGGRRFILPSDLANSEKLQEVLRF